MSPPVLAAALSLAAATWSPQVGADPRFIDLAGETARQVVVDRQDGQYLGHPSTVLLEDGRTLLCAYPLGHGRGAIALKRSADGGRSWSERLPVPASWAGSLETPTIHRTVDADGARRLILFSGLFPIRMSISPDDGASWSELEPIGPPGEPFGGIVAMASVAALRGASGQPDGRYLALFHDDGRFLRDGGERGRFQVYRTLSADGGLTWSRPAAIAAREDAELCEPGLVRSPDGTRLAALLRENGRAHESFSITSDDEGLTWSAPRELHPALTGDRHVARYAPDGRLVVTFRDMGHGSATRGDWVAWVGTWDDLADRRPGQYRVRLMDNLDSWDCGYAGLEVLPDGTLVATSYGHWVEGAEPFVVSVRLKLEELDARAAAEPAGPDPLRQWGQWRGPLGTGVGPHADPPVAWSEEQNVRWKVPLAGSGQSTPIVWDQRLYLTSAVPTEELPAPIHDTSPGSHDDAPITHRQALVVSARARADGAPLWETEVWEGVPHQGAHVSATFASSSPVTDGERVYASFGSRGVYGLDRDGGVRWRADLGQMQVKHGHGEGSSPALFGDTLVVTCDHEGPSFVVALAAESGEERWRAARDEPTSWSTPLALEHEGVAQVIVPGSNRVRSYRLSDGAVLWECGGLSHNIVASPVAGEGLVFIGSSYETRALLALRLGGPDDLTGRERIAWRRTQGTPYVPSLLLLDGALYFLGHYQNVMTRVEARTGANAPGAFRLEGLRDIYASPLAAAGGDAPRIYVTDLDGDTLVLGAGETPHVLARNHLDDSFAASAAAVDGELFLRGARYLYCLARE